MTPASMPMERTPTPCRIRVHEEGRNSRHQARASERTFGMKRGATCGCSRRGLPSPYSVSHRLDCEPCARCTQARPQAPALVKPCPGQQRSEQGFSGSPRYSTTTMEKYKGNKKRLQGN